MNDDVFGADERFERAFDQVFSCLHEALDGDVIWDPAVVDEAAVEGKFGIGG